MMTRAEWRWAGVAAALIMLFTTVPYLIAAGAQNDAWHFSGALLAVEDGNTYIANMGQGARGAWLFTLPYSTEPHPPVLIYLFYLVLGKLAGPAHSALVVTFHIARVAGGVALLLVSYRFLAEFLPHITQRRLGLVLVALGGGLGWLLALVAPAALFGSLPIDFISPEAYSFLVLFGLPHLAVARCLFLLGLLAYLRRRGLAAGLCWLGVGLIQPLYVAVAWLILAADLVLSSLTLTPGSHGPAELEVRRPSSDVGRLPVFVLRLLSNPRWPTTLTAGLVSAPMLVYTIYIFASDPTLALWNAQNRLPSPHPLHYVLGYGLWLVPAVIGWRALWRRDRPLALLAGGWLLLVPVLLYLPIPTQRRLIEAVQLPLAALAVLGLTTVTQVGLRRALAVVLGLTLPTSLLLWLGAVAAASRPAEPIFLPAAQVAVFEWLAREAQPGQAALTAYNTGNALPAYTPLTVYIGHGPETIALETKRPRVARFYTAAAPDAERQALLAEAGLDYVLFGPHERALGSFDPAGVDYLRFGFAAGDYAVYTVVP